MWSDLFICKKYTALNKDNEIISLEKMYSFHDESLDFASFMWYLVCYKKKGEKGNEKEILI